MTIQDFITKNNLSSCQKPTDGNNLVFEPENFSVCGHNVEKIKVLCNRDNCVMHVYLYGKGMMELGEELGRNDFNVGELGFKYIVQSYGDDEITIYSIDPDSHVYDMPYHTGRSWDDLLGW